MKVRIATFCILALAVCSAYGQTAGPEGGAPPPPPPPKVNKGPLVVEREVLDKLELTSAQKDQVKAAILALGASLKEMRKVEKGAPVPDDIKEKRAAIRKTYADSIKGILTPEQFKQYRLLHRELVKKPVVPVVTPAPMPQKS